MKSSVSFDLVSVIHVDNPVAYPSIHVTSQVDGGRLKGLTVEIEHDDDATPSEVADTARKVLRPVLTLVGVGTGQEPTLGTVHVRAVSALATEPTIGIATITGRSYIVRPLRAMPSERLVCMLNADPRLRRQAEALNAARANSDVVSRIRWSYMVLEQEEKVRYPNYKLPIEFRCIRDAVSHPELDSRKCTDYFQKTLGVDFPDLKNPSHLKFLQDQAEKLFGEAVRVVEEAFRREQFW